MTIDEIIASINWLTINLQGTILFLVLSAVGHLFHYLSLVNVTANPLDDALQSSLVNLSSIVSQGLWYVTGFIFTVYFFRVVLFRLISERQ